MKHTYVFLSLVFFANMAVAQTFQFYENGRRPALKQEQTGETGYAIFYADYLHGEPTSLGETYDMNRLSCAHNTMPLGTMLKVTRVDNGASVIVRVNDRGPRAEGCIVSLSKAAAIQLDMLKLGKTRVRVESVGYSDQTPVAQTASRMESTPRSYNSDFTAKGVDTRSTLTSAEYRTNNTNSNYTRQPTDYQTSRSVQSGTQPVVQRPAQNTMTARDGGSSQYIVQFGSYRDYDNAKRHADSLRNQGASDAMVREMNTGNGVLYKVTSAAFSDKAGAQRQLDALRNNNITDGIVILLR